jgi:tetratricopeptide (TPR) repeat protein
VSGVDARSKPKAKAPAGALAPGSPTATACAQPKHMVVTIASTIEDGSLQDDSLANLDITTQIVGPVISSIWKCLDIPTLKEQKPSTQSIQEQIRTHEHLLAKAQKDSLQKELKNELALMQFDRALETLDAIFKDNKDAEYYLLTSAYCYENSGNSAQAVAQYKRLIARNDSHNIAKNKLANIYKQKGLYKEALELYYQLTKADRSNAYFHKQRAQVSLQLSDIQGALFSYQDALTYSPKDVEAIFGLAKIYLEVRYYRATDSLVNLALKLDPRNIPLRILAANSAYRQEHYNTVKEHIEENFRISQDSSAYQLKLLGIANYHLKKYQASIHCFDRMGAKEETTEFVYNYLGLAHFEMGDYAESEAAFKKALHKALSSKSASYYYYIGLNNFNLQEYDAALMAFKESFYFKKDPLMFYYMARSYDEKFSDKKAAQQYYERFLAASGKAENPFVSYSQERLSQFKTVDHFKKGTSED